MKLEVEVKNSKAEFILELLNNFSYVKTKRVLTEKKKIVRKLNYAIDNIILPKKGKLRASDANVKTKTASPVKEKFLKEFEGAIEEMNLINAGKKKARNVEDFLNEL